MNLLKKLFSKPLPFFDPAAIAAQLRKPEGILAKKVGSKMNEANAFLYDYALDSMKIKEGNEILEIGYGNGLFFGKLLDQAPGLKVSGIDYSEAMYKEATKLNKTEIKEGKLSLFHGDCKKMPFQDASFDKVFCINVVYFWDKPVDYLTEIFRVLKPGGSLYTVIRDRSSMETLPFTKFGFTLYTEDTWSKELLAAGFTKLSTVHQSEPPVEMNKESLSLQSMCIEAVKPLN